MQSRRPRSFAVPVVREIPPPWQSGSALEQTQRDRVVLSLLLRP